MSYIFLGTKHVNSFGSSSQFHVDYYYEKYRTAAKMYYRMKTILKYTNTTGGTGFYNDPVHVNFQINYNETDESKKYNQTFALKPANTGTLTNGMTWTAESSWFGFEKLTGNTPAKVSVNNSNTYGFDSPDNYFSLPIDPAMSTMIINNNQEFDVDTDENISNTIPISITKYDDSYTHKLKITIQNTENAKTVVRETSDFNDVEITFNENELSTIYTNADKSSFKLIFELFTYSGETLLGSVEIPTNANLSSTNLKPTLTTTFEEINPKVIQLLGSSANTIVQNASKLKITVNPVAHKQSTVNEVQFLHNQLQVSKKETPFEHQIDVKNSVFSITVVDSRSEKTTIEYTKNIIEYVPTEISNYSFKRVSSTSSNVKLNAIIRYKQVSFNDTPNVPTIKWKLNDGDYTTLTSDDYTIDTENNQISINNLILENVLLYTQKGTFYLEVSDLLTDDAENFDMLKGIPTYDYGEHDLQINGNLFIADENRQNRKNIIDLMRPVKSLLLTMDLINPSTIYVGTTWQLIGKGKTLVGVDEDDEDFNEAGKTGGQKTVTLTKSQIPKNQINTTKNVSAGATDGYPMQGSYDVTGTFNFGGGGEAHDNMPPYFTCYIWQRIS
jgi:hypothetical protein